jgi:predicted amino acid dehydrogenase
MDTFAFIIHPIDPKRDVSRKFPLLGRVLNEQQIDFFSTFFPPVYISEVEGITSAATGKRITGWLIACPLTTSRMLSLPVKTAYRKIIQTGRLAERLGAKILGLGAFTSVVGDSGVTIARSLDIPVTTGDSYTVAVAIESILQAASRLEIPLAGATAAIVGATGKIGSVCAEILSDRTGELILYGRRPEALVALRDRLKGGNPPAVLRTSTEIEDLKDAQLILSVTSAINTVIPADLPQPGSVICDVARPRDVSRQVAFQRQDVLVIDGGMVEIPGPANFNFDFGFPPGMAYACMAETIALALEGRFEAYTLGKQITRTQVADIAAIAIRHGFRLGGFRSFERPVTEEMLARVAARTRPQPVFV